MYISEIGWNFMGDMNLAKEMVQKSKDSGATLVKFQYWQEKYLKKGVWDEDGRRKIYTSAQLNEEKINLIKSFSEEIDIPCFFSVFNKEDAKFINNLKFKRIKIPSHEIANLDLINYCFDNFEEVYLSAGASTEEEIEKIADLSEKLKIKNLTVMHCVSCYPCEMSNVNLPRLINLKKYFPNCTLGLSDHSQSTIVPAIAAAFGVEVIEKHFTTDHNLPGRDNKFALLPEEFSLMVENHKQALLALQDKGFNYQKCESDTVNNYRGRWNNIS
jgi:sialic acid synthase SpsE